VFSGICYLTAATPGQSGKDGSEELCRIKTMRSRYHLIIHAKLQSTSNFHFERQDSLFNNELRKNKEKPLEIA